MISSDFKLEKSAKTPSFFSLLDFVAVGEGDCATLKEMAFKCGETCRFCLHKSPDDSLHAMVIFHPYKKEINEQIFYNTDSYYLLLDGAFSLKNLENGQVILLKKGGNFIAKVPKNTRYKMEILSQNLLFVEVRNKEKI